MYFCNSNVFMIMENTQTSHTDEELKARFNPEGSPLRRQQLVMLEMVTLVDKVCRKYDIPYFLYGGTLLGAVRHNGFIPWDDDLDVGLMRKDFLRLMEVLPRELPDHMVLQTNQTDKNYFYFFAKLRDTRSFLDEGAYDRAFEYRGIFIDLIPFDKLCLPLQRLRLQSYAYTLYRNGNGSESALRKIRALTWFNRNISFPILRTISKLTGGKTLTYDFGIPFHIVYDEKDIFPLSTHEFEGIQLSVPGNSHHMLQSQFGDYMRLPNLDNVEHHVERLEFYQ